MRVVAIVLAAGEGRRMGVPKALLRIGESTFLEHVCDRLGRPGVDAVVAVVGAAAARVRNEVSLPADVLLVENDRWPEGMLASVWRGLDAADSLGADAVLLQPVDHPLVVAETVDRVVSALRSGAFAAVPTHGGRRGHPGGFGREAIAALRNAPLDRGARSVLLEAPDRVVHVPGDPGCVAGIDTPDDYARLLGGGAAPPGAL